MSPHISDDDLRALIGAAIHGEDPVPPELTLAARSAIAWREMDARIAEILFDSAVDDPALAGVRAEGGPRLLSFGLEDLSIDLQLAEHDEGFLLTGQIVPAVSVRVTVRSGGGAIEVDADEGGSFRLGPIAAGPLSIKIARADGTAVRTEWFAA